MTENGSREPIAVCADAALHRPDISVIIATRNRAASLADTLASLATQETDGAFAYDVVVVDNGSTDATLAVVEAAQRGYPVPLSCVAEPRPGRPFALNAGMRHARGAWFALTDDDVIATPTWLRAMWSCAVEEGAEAIGGRILPRWTGPAPSDMPAWFLDGRMGCLDYGPSRIHGTKQRPCEWVGGNMAIRRDVVERLGGFAPWMVRAQDTEYYQRCIRHGVRVVYEPAAVVRHKVGPDRVTPEALRRWARMTGSHHAHLIPWRKLHAATLVDPDWYAWTAVLLSSWARSDGYERLHLDLLLRARASAWRQRLRQWPAWWLTLLSGRDRMGTREGFPRVAEAPAGASR